MQDLAIRFPKAEQYAFLYENAHLLLLSWDRDQAKFLFLIQGHDESGLRLDYPGETFTNRVLDAIQNIFFVQVTDDSDTVKYVLGSYFVVDGQAYGAYYERDREQPDVVLFRIEGEAPDFSLEVLDEAEFERVSVAFSEQHQDLMDIRRKG